MASSSRLPSDTPRGSHAHGDHVLLHGEYLDLPTELALGLLDALDRAPGEGDSPFTPVLTVWESPTTAPDLGDVDLVPPTRWREEFPR